MFIALAERMVDYFFALIPRSKPSKEDIQKVALIAHRGAHDNKAGIYENTMDAFQIALDLGCWGIELDVHTTLDGVFVVNHDPTLNRLWGKNSAIKSVTYAQLKELAPHIPSLVEVAERFGNKMRLFIELKTPVNDEQSLLASLAGLKPVTNYYLLTLKSQWFNTLTLFPKNALLLVAEHNNVDQWCALSIAKQYAGVLGNYLLLTNKQKKRLLAANQHVGVGFVDSRNSLYREVHRNISWLFTNQAKQVMLYIKEV